MTTAVHTDDWRQRMVRLEQTLTARNETIFDLEMTVAAIQAELDQANMATMNASTHANNDTTIQQQQQQQEQTIRHLRDELQRARHEANVIARASQRQRHVVEPSSNVPMAVPLPILPTLASVQPVTRDTPRHDTGLTIHAPTRDDNPPRPKARVPELIGPIHFSGVDAGARLAQHVWPRRATDDTALVRRYHALLWGMMATSVSLSLEPDIVWWQSLELLALTPAKSSTTTTRVTVDHHDTVDPECRPEPHTTSDAVRLLTWLLDTLSVSPAGCHFLLTRLGDPGHTLSDSNDTTSGTESILPRKRRIGSRIRIVSHTEPKGRPEDDGTALFDTVQRNLASPLWTPAMPQAPPTNVSRATPRQCQLVQRLIQELWHTHILSATSLEQSNVALQIISLLLSHSNDCTTQTLVPNAMVNQLVYCWTRAATYVLNHVLDLSDDETESFAPVRLWHVETVVWASQADTANGDTASDAHTPTTLPCLATASMAELWTWMAQALHCLRDIWNSSEPLRRAWTDQRWMSLVLAAMVDVLEYVVIPNHDDAQTHALASASVAWMSTLLHSQRTDGHGWNVGQRSLLHTRHTTCESTSEKWHFAPTAIAVAVQLFHKIVPRLQSMEYDASHDVCAALTLLRDQLVQFFHGLLMTVQHERRSHTKSGRDGNGTLTLSAILSERIHWYTSAVASLLVQAPSTTSWTTPHPDILAMLQLQMDELKEDRLEQDELS